MILQIRISKAAIPKGCAWNDCWSSPLNNQDIEWPSPQPGQNPSPESLTGHILAWPSAGDMKPMRRIPAIQTRASKRALKNCQPFLNESSMVMTLLPETNLSQESTNIQKKSAQRGFQSGKRLESDPEPEYFFTYTRWMGLFWTWMMVSWFIWITVCDCIFWPGKSNWQNQLQNNQLLKN